MPAFFLFFTPEWRCRVNRGLNRFEDERSRVGGNRDARCVLEQRRRPGAGGRR